MNPSRASVRTSKLPVLIVVATMLATTGCLDMDAGMALNRDLSGKASVNMSMDLGTFFMKMAEAIGKESGNAPPPELLTMLKTQMAAQLGEGLIDVNQLKTTLPEGVSLTESSQKLDDLKLRMTFLFAFKDVSKLPEIALPPRENLQKQSQTSSPLKPFEGLIFTDEGTTMLVTSRPKPEPTEADLDKAKAAVGDAKAQLGGLGLESILEGVTVRMAFKIDLPHSVIEQNATRKEGTTYIWELKLDAAAVAAIDKLPEPPSVRLRFRK